MYTWHVSAGLKCIELVLPKKVAEEWQKLSSNKSDQASVLGQLELSHIIESLNAEAENNIEVIFFPQQWIDKIKSNSKCLFYLFNEGWKQSSDLRETGFKENTIQKVFSERARDHWDYYKTLPKETKQKEIPETVRDREKTKALIEETKHTVNIMGFDWKHEILIVDLYSHLLKMYHGLSPVWVPYSNKNSKTVQNSTLEQIATTFRNKWKLNKNPGLFEFRPLEKGETGFIPIKRYPTSLDMRDLMLDSNLQHAINYLIWKFKKIKNPYYIFEATSYGRTTKGVRLEHKTNLFKDDFDMELYKDDEVFSFIYKIERPK